MLRESLGKLRLKSQYLTNERFTKCSICKVRQWPRLVIIEIFFSEDGERFSHTINPQTGQPVTHQLASVTVLRTSCMEADALATGLMVLGPEAGYQTCQRRKISGFLCLSNAEEGFEETMTPELDSFL